MAWDDVNLFGYDGLGEPVGLGAMYGALIGAGAGTAGAIGARSFAPDASFWKNNSELVGLGAALLAGGVMAFFPQTRHAGWTAAAVGVVANGLRAAEEYFGAGTAAAAATQKGYGAVRAQFMQRPAGLGMVQAESLSGARSSAGVNLLGAPQGAVMAAKYGHSYVR